MSSDAAIVAQLPENVLCPQPRVTELGVWGDDESETWDPVVATACATTARAVSKWQKDFQKEHTPNSLVSSFKVFVSGSVYLGVDGPTSDIDLVVLLPSHKGMASVRAIMDAETGIVRYLRDEGVSGLEVVDTSRVPLVSFKVGDATPVDVDISFAVVPRDSLGDWDVTIDGLLDLCMDAGWREAESLRALLGLLGNRTTRHRAAATGRYETWRRAVVVVREMARTMGILSNMCRLLSPTAICVVVLQALEDGALTLTEAVVAALRILAPPRVNGTLAAVHVYDPHVQRAPESMCPWRTSLQSDSRADAFLMSGSVHAALADVLLAHLRNADQAIGPRCLFVWYPTSADTHCCTVLVTHAVAMPQYITIYNALTACRKRVEGVEDPHDIFSWDGVLYGHVLNSVRIDAHPKQAIVVMALAQLVDDIAYDSHRSVHTVLWPHAFKGPTAGSVVYYIAVRGVANRTPELRLDALLHMRLSLCGVPDITNIVSIQTYNPTACTAAEREWVDRAVLTFPRTVMPWPPAARAGRDTPSSPRS